MKTNYIYRNTLDRIDVRLGQFGGWNLRYV